MTIEQVLQLVRALFAAQIDRESHDMREWLLRQIVAALTTETQDDPVRAALDAAVRSDNEATAARARTISRQRVAAHEFNGGTDDED